MRNKTQDDALLDPQRLASMLTVAKRAAKAAEQVIKKYYLADEQGLEIKSDATPVTLADKECERVIRSILEQSFPEHGVFGEELGRSDKEESDFLWLIDPIDGTKSFVRGYAYFSTQIALMYRGELVLGVSNAPVYGEMAWAYQGGGAFLNDKSIKVNKDFATHSACISSGNIHSLIKEKWRQFGELLLKFGKTRGYGDFCHYHLLASGKIDLVVESDVNILDIAALTVIVREAGGVMTDLEGNDINLDTRNVLAGGQKAHAIGIETLHE